MKLDKAGLNLLKSFEGYSGDPYPDAAGLMTIGYGHLITPGESFPFTISIEQAEQLLAADARKAETAVNDLVTVPLSQNQFNALVSLVYNIGAGAFERSTLLRKLNAGDYAGAFNEFARWNRAGGRVVAGLVARRQKEAEIFAA